PETLLEFRKIMCALYVLEQKLFQVNDWTIIVDLW
ncbi:unnamed protein product, partial [marine sediment metagenome]